MDAALLATLAADRAARRAVILVTPLGGEGQRLVRHGAIAADDPLAEELEARFRSGRSGTVETAAGPVFLTVSLPPPRLVMIGAVHISQALAPMAALAGLAPVVVDPRTAFATPDRFPGVPLHAEWPQDIAALLAFDPWTAVAALTHDPKIDDPALDMALAAKAFYIGALGSRKTHARRVERLLAAGRTAEEIAAIRAPIGLPISAATPAEIAVAVLAEVIAALRAPAAAREPAESREPVESREPAA